MLVFLQELASLASLLVGQYL